MNRIAFCLYARMCCIHVLTDFVIARHNTFEMQDHAIKPAMGRIHAFWLRR